jgi:hypothetical protein
MTAPARNNSPAWCGPAVAPVSKRVTGAAAAQPTCTAGGGVILLPPPSPAPTAPSARPPATVATIPPVPTADPVPASEGATHEDHDADTCPDCGAGLCAELVSYDPGTGETMYEARDYCAACGLVPAIRPAAAVGVQAVGAPAAAPREYDFSPPVFTDDDIAF